VLLLPKHLVLAPKLINLSPKHCICLSAGAGQLRWEQVSG